MGFETGPPTRRSNAVGCGVRTSLQAPDWEQLGNKHRRESLYRRPGGIPRLPARTYIPRQQRHRVEMTFLRFPFAFWGSDNDRFRGAEGGTDDDLGLNGLR